MQKVYAQNQSLLYENGLVYCLRKRPDVSGQIKKYSVFSHSHDDDYQKKACSFIFRHFLAILVHRAYGPKKSVNFSPDFAVLSMQSIGPMPQNRQKKVAKNKPAGLKSLLKQLFWCYQKELKTLINQTNNWSKKCLHRSNNPIQE